jgi:uncharacterized protein YyaL (SSP411 family)
MTSATTHATPAVHTWPVATFGRVGASDALGNTQPLMPLDDHLDAALAWLERAHDQAERGGVSYGYSLRGGWLPPYRETSGYILTTLYRAADALARPQLAQRAEQVARWLVSVQNADGSFANPKYGSDGIVFDTGQDLFGLVTAWERTQDPVFLEAAQRAGAWLVKVADEFGIWTRYEHKNTPHVYNTRTAWALLRLNEVAPQPQWVRVARTNLDWAVACQRDSGFFDHNAFVEGDAPYTHNISYAICGLQESGWLLDDDRYLASARRCSDAARTLMRSDGFIPGQIDPLGTPVASYSCLTGQCQLAIVWAKQFARTGEAELQAAAQRSLRFVMSHQRCGDGNPGVRGAIAGSFPVYGRYAPLSYPNWASKFFVDAALLQRAWSPSA